MNIEALTQSATLTRAVSDATNAPGPRVAQSDKAQTAQPVEPAAAAQPKAQAPAPTFDAVKAAAAQIDSYLKSVGRNLDIHVDKETGRTIVQVRDSETGDVIRQIPNEETLRLARSLGESGAAILDLTA